jgi:carbon-monoxide dehydrogenase medium subunit
VEAVTHIAHYQIRNRGTIGGSLAHADPAAEMPAVALCCEATLRIFGKQGWREVPIEEFLVGPLTTSLEPDEILVEIDFPNWDQRRKHSFSEFARRKGDFALAGICVALDFGAATDVTQARVVCFGASEQQARLSKTEAFLETIKLTADACREASRIAKSEVQATTDLHSSADYRKSLCGTLLRRGLTGILAECGGHAN